MIDLSEFEHILAEPKTDKPKVNLNKLAFKDFIIFENEDYIVINKPPFVASLDERNADKKFSVLRMAKEYSADAQLCHRLDKETSGVLAIAKNPAAYRHLAMQFEHRQVTKRYHAVANGVHDFDSISVYLPSSTSSTERLKASVRSSIRRT